MKRFVMAFIAYSATGIGVYHTFWGGSKIYGLIIIMFGLFGVLYDIFYKKLRTE
ncbi:hypothetical protein [Bacillus weihaiensis]|uniref:hypothetical protein n=1 Tax=Bacillus weihaiensis TaxID=1547283 RepID=UPI0013141C68|nr:hypothetical protein [Bacillus weihaiensis]